jgi:hypothetical protein
VRQRLTAWSDPLRWMYTPADDPDANRLAWLWRWSRREVTQHHQRTTCAALREEIQGPFQPLRQPPALVLRQMGSPCAAQVAVARPLPYAA